MSTETRWFCDRCNRRLDDGDPWLQLTVRESEVHLIHETRIDLCDGCEDDMVRFMDGVTNKFVEKVAG